jgi:hypothetical protein
MLRWKAACLAEDDLLYALLRIRAQDDDFCATLRAAIVEDGQEIGRMRTVTVVLLYVVLVDHPFTLIRLYAWRRMATRRAFRQPKSGTALNGEATARPQGFPSGSVSLSDAWQLLGG